MTKLVIVESPTKAATIKKYLGKGYIIAASVGHIRDLPQSRFAIDVDNGFAPEYIPIRGKANIINDLKKLAKSADKVFLAPDPDREGEAISWHLATLLNLDPAKDVRVTFNEITKTAIKEGMNNARSINMDLVDAQQARRVLDRIVGYKISPFLWKKVKPGLSAGRVQSVVVKLIVDREREIRAFEPEEYWTIDADLLTEGKKPFTAKYYGTATKKKELTCKEDADAVLADIDGAEFKVVSIKHVDKSRAPLPPFMTSTLLQEAAKRLNFTSQRTMRIAQELYEGVSISGRGTVGMITYMRTDSLRLSNEVIASARSFIGERFGSAYLPSAPRHYKTKKSAQDAHEAIRPTDPYLVPAEVKSSLSSDQYRLYKLIWERFIACQMTNALLDNVNVDVLANRSMFKTSGFTVKFPGFMSVWMESKEDKEDNRKLPDMNEGEIAELVKLIPEQKFTQPPARYSENTLIKELEEKEIGRPSTYSAIISTVSKRDYIRKDGKFFEPTPLGEAVTELMEANFSDIVSTEFTAGMEEKLDEIAAGEKVWNRVVGDFYDDFKHELTTAEEKLGDTRVKVPDEVTDIICDKCGRNMVIKMGRNGKFLACPGFPECRNTKPLTEDAIGACPVCGGKIVARRSKKGAKFYGCSNYPGCKFMTWDDPTKESCPQCGSTLFVKRNFRYRVGVHCLKEGCGYERLNKSSGKSAKSGEDKK
ncbi:MAG: type I DNA topoisomerase [Clostridia bacterium]|nr:type I DNA topoisomerase [Clostridia bacterium]